MTCVQRLKITGMVVAWCDLPKNPRMDKLLRDRGDLGLCTLNGLKGHENTRLVLYSGLGLCPTDGTEEHDNLV